MKWIVSAASALSAIALATPAAAQRSGEVTLFSNTGFSGARYTVTGQRNILNIPFRVRSILMADGDAWQLCTRTQIRDCATYRSSDRNVALYVRSARPVPAGGPGNYGPSLRGMASQYFTQPQINGARVRSDGTAAAAASRANDFCRRAGWTRSAYQRLQTVSGRVYLADVLCVRGMV